MQGVMPGWSFSNRSSLKINEVFVVALHILERFSHAVRVPCSFSEVKSLRKKKTKNWSILNQACTLLLACKSGIHPAFPARLVADWNLTSAVEKLQKHLDLHRVVQLAAQDKQDSSQHSIRIGSLRHRRESKFLCWALCPGQITSM